MKERSRATDLYGRKRTPIRGMSLRFSFHRMESIPTAPDSARGSLMSDRSDLSDMRDTVALGRKTLE